MSIPIPPAPWVPTATHSETHLFPEPTMAALTAKMVETIGVDRAAFLERRTVGMFLGDSYTNQNGGTTGSPSYSTRGFVGWGGALARNRFTWTNRGIGGDTLPYMRARLGAALTADNPGFVHLLGGLNDGPTSVSIEDSLSALDEIVDTVRALGIPMLIGTVPGRTAMTSGERDSVDAINRHIRGIRFPNVHIVDYNAALVDPATGLLDASLSFDGTHPNSLGAYAMGRLLAPVLDRILPAGDPLINVEGAEGNLIPHGRFIAGALAVNTPPTGWTQAIGAGTTYERVPRTDGVQGEWLQMNKVGESAISTIVSDWIDLPSNGLVPGDIIEAAVEFECDGLNPTPALKGSPGLLVQYADASNNLLSFVTYFNITSTEDQPTGDRSCVFYIRAAVPSTAGISKVRLHLSAYATGSYRYDRASLRKIS